MSIIEGIKSDIKDVYNNRLAFLERVDKFLSEESGIKQAIMRKGAGAASIENILRSKMLQEKDQRAEQFLSIANRIDAILTVGSVSCLRSAMVMGQFIGEALAKPVNFICEKTMNDKADDNAQTLSAGRVLLSPVLSLTAKIKVNTEEATGIWAEIKKAYDARMEDLEELNLLIKNTKNLSDTILLSPNLAKAMKDIQFRKALFIIGGENF